MKRILNDLIPTKIILILVLLHFMASCSSAPIIGNLPLSIRVNLLNSDNKIVKQKTLNQSQKREFMNIFNKSRKITINEVIKETLKEGSYDMIIEAKDKNYSFLMMNSKNFYKYQNNEYYENESLYKLIKDYLN